jgi:hypothetical protein
MKFGEALELCRNGKRIRRAGWNGKNQLVYYQEGSYPDVCQLRCEAVREWARRSGLDRVKIMGHFDIKTTSDIIQCGWLATQGDMLADDWAVWEFQEVL